MFRMVIVPSLMGMISVGLIHFLASGLLAVLLIDLHYDEYSEFNIAVLWALYWLAIIWIAYRLVWRPFIKGLREYRRKEGTAPTSSRIVEQKKDAFRKAQLETVSSVVESRQNVPRKTPHRSSRPNMTLGL